jgi:hypothetical protein
MHTTTSCACIHHTRTAPDRSAVNAAGHQCFALSDTTFTPIHQGHTPVYFLLWLLESIDNSLSTHTMHHQPITSNRLSPLQCGVIRIVTLVCKTACTQICCGAPKPSAEGGRHLPKPSKACHLSTTKHASARQARACVGCRRCCSAGCCASHDCCCKHSWVPQQRLQP